MISNAEIPEVAEALEEFFGPIVCEEDPKEDGSYRIQWNDFRYCGKLTLLQPTLTKVALLYIELVVASRKTTEMWNLNVTELTPKQAALNLVLTVKHRIKDEVMACLTT